MGNKKRADGPHSGSHWLAPVKKRVCECPLATQRTVYIPLKPEADGEGGVHTSSVDRVLQGLLSRTATIHKGEAVGQMPRCFKPHPNPPHSGFL